MSKLDALPIITSLADTKIDRAAATSLAKRHADGSLPVEDFNLELENQSGEKVQLGSETDQRYDNVSVLNYIVIKVIEG